MADNNLFDGLKEAVQRQIKEAYMEGAHHGATTTCAIIYQTMKAAGLEEDNFLFLILKDLAKQHGCDDLAEVADKLQSKGTPASNELLS
jgi:tRNA threonylcarbamoyladenosine modification (KEOPS) complex Cgi121 subunit